MHEAARFYRLECNLPLSADQKDMLNRLNHAAAEVAGTSVDQLPVVKIASGLDHDDAFTYAFRFPHRKASNYLGVLVRDAAITMGILPTYLQPSLAG